MTQPHILLSPLKPAIPAAGGVLQYCGQPRALLAGLTQCFAQHPWLLAKLERLHALAAQDPQMMGKEARFSSRKMSRPAGGA